MKNWADRKLVSGQVRLAGGDFEEGVVSRLGDYVWGDWPVGKLLLSRAWSPHLDTGPFLCHRATPFRSTHFPLSNIFLDISHLSFLITVGNDPQRYLVFQLKQVCLFEQLKKSPSTFFCWWVDEPKIGGNWGERVQVAMVITKATSSHQIATFQICLLFHILADIVNYDS